MNRISITLLGAVCLIVVLAGPIQALSASVEWSTANGGNGHFYDVIEETLTWTEAKAAAEARGWHLVTITSEAENDFVLSLLLSDTGAPIPDYWDISPPRSFGPWIGARQPEDASEPDGDWYWVTGEPFEYSAWCGREPNNGGDEDFAHYFTNTDLYTSPGWNDVRNTWYVPAYIVESEPIPEPSSLILAMAGLFGLGVLIRWRKR